jgi:Fe-S cluster biogenesis protein NfuA
MEKPKFINIYTESSPNPNSQKFVFNFYLLENMTFDFIGNNGTENCPLAQELFSKFEYIEGIFIAANFITVTKKPNFDWFEINLELKEFLRQYVTDEKPLFLEGIKQEVAKESLVSNANDSEQVAQIKAVLEDYVRPAVESDGGAISFHSFEEGVVKVVLQGSCSGCPSSTVTLKSGIENLMKRMVQGVERVEAV